MITILLQNPVFSNLSNLHVFLTSVTSSVPLYDYLFMLFFQSTHF